MEHNEETGISQASRTEIIVRTARVSGRQKSARSRLPVFEDAGVGEAHFSGVACSMLERNPVQAGGPLPVSGWVVSDPRMPK